MRLLGLQRGDGAEKPKGFCESLAGDRDKAAMAGKSASEFGISGLPDCVCQRGESAAESLDECREPDSAGPSTGSCDETTERHLGPLSQPAPNFSTQLKATSGDTSLLLALCVPSKEEEPPVEEDVEWNEETLLEELSIFLRT